MRNKLKLFLILTVCAVFFSGCQEAVAIGIIGLNIEKPTTFTVRGNPYSSRSITFTEEESLNRITALLNGARRAEPSLQNPERIAEVIPNGEEGAAYAILEDSSGLYIQVHDEYLAINGEEFFELLAAHAKDFYRYESLPKVVLDDKELTPSDSSYAYRQLDGKFYEPRLSSPASVPAIEWDDNELPLPEFIKQPNSVSVTVLVNGEPVLEGTPEDAAALRLLGDTEYTVEVTATYSSSYYQGDTLYRYIVRTEPWEIIFTLSGYKTVPGEAVVLFVENLPDDAVIFIDSDIPFTPTFFSAGENARLALLPISYFVAPGQHYVRLTVDGVRSASEQFDIIVENKEFAVQNLTVSEETSEQTIYSQEANDEYNRVIPPLRAVMDDIRHWEGRFILPVAEGYIISTEFGTIRYTNGSSSATRHGAIDYALPLGTPVIAPNHGRVLHAGFLKLTGNTILIEHGYGLKTWYYHMDTLAVETGEMVSMGQNLGTVGTTGFSTGPHLHYGMSVNGVFINPNTASQTDMFAFD